MYDATVGIGYRLYNIYICIEGTYSSFFSFLFFIDYVFQFVVVVVVLFTNTSVCIYIIYRKGSACVIITSVRNKENHPDDISRRRTGIIVLLYEL